MVVTISLTIGLFSTYRQAAQQTGIMLTRHSCMQLVVNCRTACAQGR